MLKRLLFRGCFLGCFRGCFRPISSLRFFSQDISAIKSRLKSMETSGSTQLEIHGDLAKVILNHPEKRNAVTASMILNLHDITLEMEEMHKKDPTSLRYFLLTSRGGFFCAGGDKRFVQQILTPEKGQAMSLIMHDAFKRLSKLHLLSATFVEGSAIGGGAELSLWTDFLLLHSNTGKIGFVHSKMGLMPAWASGYKLVEQVGARIATRLLLLGEILNAQKALDLGLAHDLVESEDDAIDWLKTKTSHLSPEIVEKVKKLIGLSGDRDDILKKEKDLAVSVWSGPTHLAAIKMNIKHRK